MQMERAIGIFIHAAKRHLYISGVNRVSVLSVEGKKTPCNGCVRETCAVRHWGAVVWCASVDAAPSPQPPWMIPLRLMKRISHARV